MIHLLMIAAFILFVAYVTYLAIQLQKIRSAFELIIGKVVTNTEFVKTQNTFVENLQKLGQQYGKNSDKDIMKLTILYENYAKGMGNLQSVLRDLENKNKANNVSMANQMKQMSESLAKIEKKVGK